jgi:acetolactate synthase-1/2/3 large subunit
MKYSDMLMSWLEDSGYTHCFFVGGGNVMHLLESARTRFKCVPVIHEVAAAIGAEYFNASNPSDGPKAFAMVTAGPGVTNLVTGVAGAWLESRELLIIAGQARTDALSRGKVRQIGHQEIDGAGIMRPISKLAMTIEKPIGKEEFQRAISISKLDRKGPVFLEFCIDVTAVNIQDEILDYHIVPTPLDAPNLQESDLLELRNLLQKSQRPLFLFGGGLDRDSTLAKLEKLEKLGVPISTTWNGSDRYPGTGKLYAGRPNTYGMRSANIIIQQADLVIALGTRLGLQQTGFNWQKFVPVGNVVQVDIDRNELDKESPTKILAINSDANQVLDLLLDWQLDINIQSWLDYIELVRTQVPLKDSINNVKDNYVEPFDFVAALQNESRIGDQIIPCSSGGAFTTMMQAFELKQSQIMITNKGLASMGYGLSGAIGSSLAHPDKRTILTEGDGGFAQNYQELGTAVLHNLNLKVFIYSNQGYASIRTMQKNYFNNNYIGCDLETGVGFPSWDLVFQSYNIPYVTLTRELFNSERVLELFNSDCPAAFIVPLDPEQVYYPKISSKVLPSGRMESNPLHLMSPPLDEDRGNSLLRYLPENLRN